MLQKYISNGVKFHQAKVIKVIHEESKSLLICNDGVSIQASVVLDATGFSRCLVQYDKPYDPGYQVAYGILAEVEEHPFDVDKMVFMDWRDSHLNNNLELKESNSKIPTFLYAMPFSSDRIFLEETSLVARPGVPMKDIQERMVARLRHLGIKVKSIEEDERCVIPMGGPLPVLPQRVVGIGGTAGMVHPSTGYMVARTLAAAPIVANSIVQYLGSDRRVSGGELSDKVWKDLWPIERRRQREFFCFGMDVLLKLDLPATRRFFDAFFNLEPHYWHGFLSSRLFLPELLLFGLSLFSHASNTSSYDAGNPCLPGLELSLFWEPYVGCNKFGCDGDDDLEIMEISWIEAINPVTYNCINLSLINNRYEQHHFEKSSDTHLWTDSDSIPSLNGTPKKVPVLHQPQQGKLGICNSSSSP
ncbi:hypothetical protein DKX38_023680 [Salix brachista]|uniref:lycopene beta-cyclase n=1 Tax=Salix brachista TaxID=2182728 RepID=A0A5N5JJF9_9ROSI|nr:hypothetical protein DKX38_023680 [Salix brachista]